GFETVSKHFQVIDNLTSSVIVPHEEGVDLIAQLNRGLSIDEITNTLKKLQMYAVQVYSEELNKLAKAGALVPHYDGMFYELKDGFYSDEFGLNMDGGERMVDLMI